MSHLPKWKDMPAVKGMPHGCAWGLWDKPGQEKDQLGSLNLLTPEVVQEAFKELKTGERCALKYFPCPPIPTQSLLQYRNTKYLCPSIACTCRLICSWRMDYPVASPVPRETLQHTTKPVPPQFGYSHDDIVSFNTQCSSQWDGLRNPNTGFRRF
jgi:hypothetical protein